MQADGLSTALILVLFSDRHPYRLIIWQAIHYFLFDRSLLLELSRCIWETLKIYYQSCLPGKNSVPGAVIAIQTFGDFLGFNPHGHVLITDGCFPEKGLFVVAPTVKLQYLLAAMTSHIPDQGQQMVRYYGFSCNVSRGLRQKVNQDAQIPLTSLEILFESSHLTMGWLV